MASINPLACGVDGLRAASINGAYFGILADLAVLTALAFVVSAIGGYLFSKIQI